MNLMAELRRIAREKGKEVSELELSDILGDKESKITEMLATKLHQMKKSRRGGSDFGVEIGW